MDGDDEARARATLLEMQVRLSQGPHIALGIAELSTPEQVRRAFLELTKQFHPARFGRMSSDLQKMSNEVFLGIKSAHEQMLRTLGSSLRPRASGSGAHASGGVPQMTTQVLPAGSSGVRQSQPVPVVRATGQIPPLRASSTQPPVNQTRPLTPTGARTTPPTGVPITRTPAAGSPAVARTLTPAGRLPTPTQRPASPTPRAGTPPRSGEIETGPLRYAGTPHTQPQRAAPAFDERAAFDEGVALLGKRDWSAARTAFHALAVRVPQSRQYRALLCYSRGREAVAAGKVDDAAMEYQRALQLDPELAQAKQALAEIRRR